MRAETCGAPKTRQLCWTYLPPFARMRAGVVEVLRLQRMTTHRGPSVRSGFTGMFGDSMKKFARLSIGPGLICCLLTGLSSPGVLSGQTTNLLSSGPGKAGEPLNWTTQQDHKNMMDQLGISRLRPGPSGQPGATNSANYDPAKANPFPDLPEVLTLKNGRKVTSAEMWWKQRRPEIVEDLEREVIGRVPNNVPGMTWTVVSNITNGLVGNLPANGKRLVGHVDNSACPAITVDI